MIRVGLVGSGKIALEYARVIDSFNHKIEVIVTKNKSRSKKTLIRKYKIQNEIDDFESALKKFPQIDFWIICNATEYLVQNLKIAIKYKVKFLIEKSILIKSKNLKKITNNLKEHEIENFFVAYNRNFYDFIIQLIQILKNDAPKKIIINMADPFTQIIKKRGIKFKRNLVKFMTSHWIALILKILENLNYKIQLKNIIKFFSKGYLGYKFLYFKVKKSKKEILINFNLIPDNPSNTSISFYGKKNIILSPIEKIHINSGIKKKMTNNQNIYVPIVNSKKTSDKFKPGFKLMYKSFFEKVLNKKKNTQLVNIKDLVKIYSICEIFEE
jgi:hypothetical protein